MDRSSLRQHDQVVVGEDAKERVEIGLASHPIGGVLQKRPLRPVLRVLAQPAKKLGRVDDLRPKHAGLIDPQGFV